jgi:predicted extracellular nuclease
MKKIYTLLFSVAVVAASSAQVVISQVYGGGGNAGAVYSNDFIELFNRGAVPVSLNGWSVQYASNSGVSWALTALPNVTIQPGKYYLIQQAAGTIAAASLPTPDLDAVTCSCTVSGATIPAPQNGIAMSGTNGKVILSNTTTAETTANPIGSQIVDKVGYGSANGFETGPTPVLTNSTAAVRNAAGCADTDNNSSDFTVVTPVARNSASATNTCTLSVAQNQIEGLKIYPNPITNGTFYINTNSDSTKEVVVYDVLGKQVVKTSTANAVNVANLKGGVYIVKITEDGKTATRKLIIR